MIVHVFNNQKKFSLGYFRFLNDFGFNFADTVLYHYGKHFDGFDAYGIDCHFLPSWFLPVGHLKMLSDLKQAEKIVVHCLASPQLLLLLLFNKNLRRKVWWIVWGKDLYLYHISERKTPPLVIYELLRRSVFKDVGHLVGIPGDLKLAKKWYNTSGEPFIMYLAYPYAVDYPTNNSIDLHSVGQISILLGNSGSKTNDHEEAIKILSSITGVEKIYCPLSYGGPRKYTNSIRELGEKTFGDTFIPLMDFLPLNEYKAIWDAIDIAVFNHKRQEGIDNIFSLILRKKTIYINPTTTTYTLFKELGVTICAFLPGCTIAPLPMEVREKNAEILSHFISPDQSAKDWAKVLNTTVNSTEHSSVSFI